MKSGFIKWFPFQFYEVDFNVFWRHILFIFHSMIFNHHPLMKCNQRQCVCQSTRSATSIAVKIKQKLFGVTRTWWNNHSKSVSRKTRFHPRYLLKIITMRLRPTYHFQFIYFILFKIVHKKPPSQMHHHNNWRTEFCVFFCSLRLT